MAELFSADFEVLLYDLTSTYFEGGMEENPREPGRDMYYLVGTPKGRINKHEKKWLDLRWQQVRDSVSVKLFEDDGEIYVLASSDGRQATRSRPRTCRSCSTRSGSLCLPSLLRESPLRLASGSRLKLIRPHGLW